MTNLFVCKSKRLAGYLVSSGCECKKVDVDKINPNFMIFLFEKTEQWDKSMKKWQEKIK